MLTLRELQLQFKQCLNNERNPTTIFITENLTIAKRLQIYQTTINSNLINSLKMTYPCLEKLVGMDFFLHLCQSYIKKHFSTSGDLNNYGERLANFLTDFVPIQELVYLPDIARLEWAYQQVLHAANSTKNILIELAKLDTNQYQQIIFKLNKACKLINSNYPLKKIWDLCQQPEKVSAPVNLNEPGKPILIYRPQFNVLIEELTQLEYELLIALTSGNSLGKIYAEFMEKNPDFTIDASLQKFMSSNILAIKA